MRISDWSSDVCSSDLRAEIMIRQDEAQGHGDVRNLVCKIEKSGRIRALVGEAAVPIPRFSFAEGPKMFKIGSRQVFTRDVDVARLLAFRPIPLVVRQSLLKGSDVRSEEHTSELQSLMRTSYAVFCLKKKKNKRNT